jgi:hypothetical protein
MYPRIQSLSGLITESTAENIIKIYNNNNKIFIPDIYQYNITDNRTEKIFPVTSQIPSLSSAFTLSSEFNNEINFNIVKIQKPILTYNSLNDIYKLTYICTDNNNLFHLLDYSFKIDQNKVVTFIDSKYYNHNNIIRRWNGDITTHSFNQIKSHIFLNISDNKFEAHKDFSKISIVVNDSCISNYLLYYSFHLF